MLRSQFVRFGDSHPFQSAVHFAGALAKSKLRDGYHSEVIARFEEFLETRRYEPVYLAEICTAIGVSERTLRSCCQQYLGMAPIHYLWLRRMHLARNSLLSADSTLKTVTEIATAHGFWELGRFSVEYRTLFGESPSATLKRAPEQFVRRKLQPSAQERVP
jgi:transcriptional regulator GlxA family with amidase domain